MEMRTFETMTEAIADLKQRGYVHDFNLHPEWIDCPPLNLRMTPDQFHVDEVYRFEGATNPDDSSVLYAVNSWAGVKGLIVDAYGVYAESLSNDMITKLKIDSKTRH